MKACINKFCGCFELRVVFQSTHHIKSLFPYKDRLTRAQMSRVVYKASCWDCQEFYIGKTKRRLHDRKTEHFKSITSSNHSSAIAEHVTSTGHNMKWDHFEILARGRSDTHCKIKETLLIRDLQPSLNENVSSEKLYLFQLHVFPSICKFFCYLLSFVSIISYLLHTQISVVIPRFTTSEDVCWNMRNVNIKPFFFPEMRLYFLMFITAVCFLFLLKLRRPKKQKYLQVRSR